MFPQQGGSAWGSLGDGQPAAWPGPYQPFTGMEGWPMVGGGGGTNLMFQTMLSGFAQNAMGSAGMMPMGLSHQNMYDRFQAQYFTQQHNQLIQRMAERDRPAIMQMWQGIAHASGQPWGADQYRAANALASAQIMASPLLVEMAPMALDAMMGERGSAAVMSHYMMRGSRNAIDPVTGRWGLNAEMTEDLTTRLYDRLFASRRARDSFGLSAGEAGQLTWALRRQGMLPSANLEALQLADPGFMDTAMRGVGLTGSVDDLRSGDRDLLMSQPKVQERLKSFNARRIADTLREWSGSIHAMREIFGDAGMPNAPMPMLIGALEQLTAGGMSQFQPGRVQNMVRNTANLASMSGVGMQGAMMLQQAATPSAQAFGLDPVFANLATQQTMAFTAGYNAIGMGAHRGWGSGNLATLQQMDLQLQTGAAASQSANQMGALMRMRRMGVIAAGSSAARYLNAMEAGSTQFKDAAGNVRSLDMSAQAYADMVAASTGGTVSGGEALYMLQQNSANQEMLANNPVAIAVTRRLQRDDFAREATYTMGGAAAQVLASRGVDSRSADVIGRVLGGAGQRAFYSMNPEVMADPNAMRTAMAAGMMTDLARIAHGGGPNAGAAQEVLARAKADPNFLQSLSGVAFAEWDQRLRETNRGTARQNYALMNDNVLQESARARAQSQINTNLQNAMAPIGQRNMVRRAVEQIMQTKPGDEGAWKGILGKTLGGERKGEMMKIMGKRAERLEQLGLEYQRIGDEIQATTDPEERKRKWTEAQQTLKAIKENLTELDDRFKAAGLDLHTVIDQGDIAQFQKHSAKIDELIGSKGDLSKEATGIEAFSQERANTRDMLAQYFSDPRSAAAMGKKGLESIRTIREMENAIDILSARTGKTAQQLGEEGNAQFLAMRDKRNEAFNYIAGQVGTIPADGNFEMSDELRKEWDAELKSYGDPAGEASRQMFKGLGWSSDSLSGNKRWANIREDIASGGRRGRVLEANMREIGRIAGDWDKLSARERAQAKKRYGGIFGDDFGHGGGLLTEEALLEELENIRQSVPMSRTDGDPEQPQELVFRVEKLVVEANSDGSATIRGQGSKDEGQED